MLTETLQQWENKFEENVVFVQMLILLIGNTVKQRLAHVPQMRGPGFESPLWPSCVECMSSMGSRKRVD